MTLQQRIELLAQLGSYIENNDTEWQMIKERAGRQNPWFIPEFIDLASTALSREFLTRPVLEEWTKNYGIPQENPHPKLVGIVMAGNIPLVGFHDFLCTFITGHRMAIKLSSKDDVLLPHLVAKLEEWNPAAKGLVQFAETLKGCDAYVATGSNNSGRYFEYYFSKYPNIIRKNRTSVAVLDGQESADDLINLAKDIQLYFGLGCRNVTKLYVPENYNFMPLLETLKQYDYFLEFHKYKHNFDYQLALLIMNNKYYMNSGAVVVTENSSPFSPISQVHFEYYTDKDALLESLKGNEAIQCVVGKDNIPFGSAQQPSLIDYADGVDTMAFLKDL
ncbi:acyl-CoA reductase [Danxiaibacter flavus]|uniref:Acyl-CoA reductase n=1 Tax=Danxiaibacter flavus TaxID=3049108 RepID=A0ABV3ZD79_9BACT|nr:acyl-CoA reductase [Chitinophagaceae bacterium DXS]